MKRASWRLRHFRHDRSVGALLHESCANVKRFGRYRMANRGRFAHSQVKPHFESLAGGEGGPMSTVICRIFALLSIWAISAPGSALATEREVTYYYTDHQGSVIATTDAAGNISSANDYRPYGMSGSGSPDTGPGFTGHVNDPDTQLVYMQQRYYDPQIGRFLSGDSVRANGNGDWRHFNRYAYAYSNPMTHSDPDGRCPVCLVIVGASLFTLSDYANAPGIGEKSVTLSPAEKLEAVAGALPASKSVSAVRSVIRTTEGLTQRAASREAKRQVNVPTSQQAASQSNGKVAGTNGGRQQTFEVPKDGGGTELKSVQVSRDVQGDHAGMPQIEAGTINVLRDPDPAGRPRITNESKVRVDFDPTL